MNDILYIGAMDCSHLIDLVEFYYYRETDVMATLSINLAPSEELRLLLDVQKIPQVFVCFKRPGIPLACWQLQISQERDDGKGWWITG